MMCTPCFISLAVIAAGSITAITGFTIALLRWYPKRYGLNKGKLTNQTPSERCDLGVFSDRPEPEEVKRLSIITKLNQDLEHLDTLTASSNQEILKLQKEMPYETTKHP